MATSNDDKMELVQLCMHAVVFDKVKEFLESNYPMMVYRMPDEAQEEGFTTYGVAPTNM